MRLLLDTHVLLWWLSDDPALTRPARKAIAKFENKILVSAASAWEIATKFRIGKLETASVLVTNFVACIQAARFEMLSISPDHALRAGLLPGPHKDPFDRMLIAQAQAENLALVTNEEIFDSYGVRRIW